MPRLLDTVRAAKPDSEGGPNRTQRTIRILIVDDDPPVLRAHARVVSGLNKIFEQNGLALSVVVQPILGGPNAIKEINDSEPFDLIITDYHMPKATGLDVLRAAKKKDTRTKVLIFSGEISELESIEAKASGADGVFIKPIPSDIIRSEVKKNLGIPDTEISPPIK